jgi:hypothetical protein
VTEKQLGESLLTWDAYGKPTDPRAVTLAVLDRDKRRVGRWTVVTVILWVLAFVAVAAMVCGHFVFLQPRLWWHAQQTGSKEVRDWIMVAELAAKTIFAVAAMVLLAALSTVALVFASRRATLRQVNANLAAIADELRQLRTGERAIDSQHAPPRAS